VADATRGKGRRGSVLALVPAAVLVLVLLGAIAVDFAAVFLAQRQLADATSAAANDAAGAALSDAAFYQGGGRLAVDPVKAATVVCNTLTAQLDARIHLRSVELAVGTRWVHVRASATVDHVIARSVPGVAHSAGVTAAAAAVALRRATEQVPDTSLVWQPLSC
jgi:Flp pilus assembly protein TadG